MSCSVNIHCCYREKGEGRQIAFNEGPGVSDGTVWENSCARNTFLK